MVACFCYSLVGYSGSKIYILGKQMKLIEFAKKHGLRIIKCRYCKKEVLATAPCQKVCKSVGCQKQRQAEKQKRYNDKKRK